MKRREKIVVAMSGGVDSSTVAAILAAQRHEVIGVFMKFPVMLSGEQRSSEPSSVENAAQIASILGIEFQELDFTDVFEANVINYLCSAYLDGITPNPCVVCNRLVKFGFLLEKAIELGADRLATGHYAKTEFDAGYGRYILKKGTDPEKDQSYFLYSLSQQQLERVLFPLANMTKKETYAKAESFGLNFKNRRSSSDICFLAGGDYREFLAKRHPEMMSEGLIIDVENIVLGRHQGVAFHTIGQRKGLRVAHREPLYVIELDGKSRTVVAGPREKLFKAKISLKMVNWIPFDQPASAIEVATRIRYRQPEVKALVTPLDYERAEVLFAEPQAGIAPGQSVVFYNDDLVVGGGVIEREKT